MSKINKICGAKLVKKFSGEKVYLTVNKTKIEAGCQSKNSPTLYNPDKKLMILSLQVHLRFASYLLDISTPKDIYQGANNFFPNISS